MEPLAVAKEFQLQGDILEVRPYGCGNINDTFLVSMRGRGGSYILQRLNSEVFAAPALVMANLRVVTGHLLQCAAGDAASESLLVAEIIPGRHGGDCVVDSHRDCWRMFRYFDRTRSFTRLGNLEQARQAGVGLGRFHRMLSDLDVSLLHDTLPGFHETPGYLAHYDEIVSAGSGKADDFCRRFIEERRSGVGVLEDARRNGLLANRVMHGDPKADNFLFAEDGDRVVALIDLDTVKPGLVHYDIGDCLRSCCNPGGENFDALDDVRFDLDRCRAILEGYFSEAAVFLATADYEFIYDAVHLIAFELGLRFYTDYLSGNSYFKVDDPDHNLRRARVQFCLTERIEDGEAAIRAIIRALQRGTVALC